MSTRLEYTDADHDPVVREARVLQAEQLRQARLMALRSLVRGTVEDHALGDVLGELAEAIDERYVQCHFEHRKHYATLADNVKHAAELADRYGL